MTAWFRMIRMLLGHRPAAMQVGAICRDMISGEVLLISSRGTGRWVIPKGWPMAGRSLAEAAAQEAWEEAGIRGTIREGELGRFTYGKAQDEGFSIPVETRVFLLEAERISDDYPEAGQRRRRWFPPQEAAEKVVEPGLSRILRALPAVADG